MALIGATALALAALAWFFNGIGADLGSPARPAQSQPTAAAEEREPAMAALAIRVADDGDCEPEHRSSVPVPEVEPRELAVAAPAPRTEHEYYRDLLARLTRRDPELLQSIPAILDGPGPDCRRIALLRALYDAHAPEMESAFVHALSTLPADSSGSAGEPVPVVATVFLARHAAADASVRRILSSVAFDSGPNLSTGLRRRLAAAWAGAIDAREMVDFSFRFYRETDAVLQAGMIAALRDNPHQSAAARVLESLGVAPAAEPAPEPVDG